MARTKTLSLTELQSESSEVTSQLSLDLGPLLGLHSPVLLQILLGPFRKNSPPLTVDHLRYLVNLLILYPQYLISLAYTLARILLTGFSKTPATLVSPFSKLPSLTPFILLVGYKPPLVLAALRTKPSSVLRSFSPYCNRS